jgi:hypothetical protein
VAHQAHGLVAIRIPGHDAFNELSERVIRRFPAIERGVVYANFQAELLDHLAKTYLGSDSASIGAAEVSSLCASKTAPRTSGRVRAQSASSDQSQGQDAPSSFHDHSEQREYFQLGRERVLENTRPGGSVPNRKSTEVSGENWAGGEARGQTGRSAGPEVAGKPRHHWPKCPARANGGAIFAWALAEGVSASSVAKSIA